MKFTNLLNLLLEANYNYTIPTDKEKLLFDFYTLEAVDRYPQIEGGSWDFGDERYFQQREGIKDTKNKLLPFLKKELLDAALFSIASELKYAVGDPDDWEDKLTPEEIESLPGIALKNGPKLVRKNPALKKFSKEFYDELYKARGKAGFSDSDIRYASMWRDVTYEAMKNTSFSEEEFIDFGEYIFKFGNWEEEYGGEAWGKIAAAWKKLNEAKGEDLYIWIDHMFSQQHNSGNVLDKLQSYRKGGGHSWITKALDLKFKAENPWMLWQKSSRDLQRLGASVLQAKGYGSAEKFIKDMYKLPDDDERHRMLKRSIVPDDKIIDEHMNNNEPDKALDVLYRTSSAHQGDYFGSTSQAASVRRILTPKPIGIHNRSDEDYIKRQAAVMAVIKDKKFNDYLKSEGLKLEDPSGRFRDLGEAIAKTGNGTELYKELWDFYQVHRPFLGNKLFYPSIFIEHVEGLLTNASDKDQIIENTVNFLKFLLKDFNFLADNAGSSDSGKRYFKSIWRDFRNTGLTFEQSDAVKEQLLKFGVDFS